MQANWEYFEVHICVLGEAKPHCKSCCGSGIRLTGGPSSTVEESTADGAVVYAKEQSQLQLWQAGLDGPQALSLTIWGSGLANSRSGRASPSVFGVYLASISET